MLALLFCFPLNFGKRCISNERKSERTNGKTDCFMYSANGRRTNQKQHENVQNKRTRNEVGNKSHTVRTIENIYSQMVRKKTFTTFKESTDYRSSSPRHEYIQYMHMGEYVVFENISYFLLIFQLISRKHKSHCNWEKAKNIHKSRHTHTKCLKFMFMNERPALQQKLHYICNID